MTSPCADPTTCLAKRRAALSYPAGDPRAFTPSPCPSCTTGLIRQMEEHRIEPDPEQPRRITPMPCTTCGVTVQKPKDTLRVLCRACYFAERIANAAAEREKNRCEECGAVRTKYSKLCSPCYKRSRQQPKVCTVKNCGKTARRGGLCDRHYRIRHPRQEAHP